MRPFFYNFLSLFQMRKLVLCVRFETFPANYRGIVEVLVVTSAAIVIRTVQIDMEILNKIR